MENAEKKPEETKTNEGLLEICIDRDHITIPVERYDELIRAEVKLGIVGDILASKSGEYDYKVKEYLSLLFSPVKTGDLE